VPELPTGTVTFLFTDLEGSTRLWEEHPDVMRGALARHDQILRDAIEGHNGHVVKSTGDGVYAAFATARDAIEATLDSQRALRDEAWPPVTGTLRVRMGVHTGEAEHRDGDYFGPPLNRAARLMAVGHGGQVLVSDSVETIVRGSLPTGSTLRDLGEHRLRDLTDAVHIYQLAHPDLPADFPALRSLSALPGNLPRQLTTFVGRHDEIHRIVALVRDRPVVTLTGVGGVGKTRLALQVAAEVAPAFPDGAWLCELAPLTDPAALTDVVATTLGVPRPVGRSVDECVFDYLAPRRLLLVLDNCEHLLDAAARFVDAAARRCPQVAILATSREGLALAGEQIVAVPSLGLPTTDDDPDPERADAVRLFVERAREVKSDFDLGGRNAEVVAQLCRRLDGIPLAIELAAARVRALTPQALLERIDQRFKLLTRGSRAALERHQTLRNTIDWSYELLEPVERTALCSLSVFVGGCDLAAAEAVVADDELEQAEVPDTLAQLVAKSLVLVDDDPETRYGLLETIRQFSQEQLEAAGRAVASRQRHADYYRTLAEHAGAGLRGFDQVEWAARTAREIDNFRAALDFAVETGSADLALRLVAPLGVYGTAIGYAAMDWARTAVMIPEAEGHPMFPVVAAWGAWGAVMHGDFEAGAALIVRAEASEAALGTRIACLRQAPATLAFFRGDFGAARRHAVEWVELAREDAEPYELAHALIMHATTLQFDDPATARRLLEEAVDVARSGGVSSALSIGLSVLGTLLDDDPDRAMDVLLEAEEIGSHIGDVQAVTQTISMRGWIACRRKEWGEALRLATRAAGERLRNGDVSLMVGDYHQAAIALSGLGLHEPAGMVLGVSDASTRVRLGPDWYVALMEQVNVDLVDALGAERLDALRGQGARMTDADAVALLRSEADRALSET
jgi:predicted ATPase/class 3 adenylate cyclase